MGRALLLIDIQRDYFPGGRHPLVGSDRAADAAGRVLAAFRSRSEPVVHVQHSWVGTDLEQRLRDDAIDQLVVAGMMTSMCVDATVRAAVDLGGDHARPRGKLHRRVDA